MRLVKNHFAKTTSTVLILKGRTAACLVVLLVKAVQLLAVINVLNVPTASTKTTTSASVSEIPQENNLELILLL